MISQQQHIDVIGNNLANVNTVGFKRERMEFQSLLYQTMRRADLDPANMTGRPVNLHVGHGVRPVAVSRHFTMGSLQRTDNMQDFAIEGDGFFVVRRTFDEEFYTRDGTFKLSPVDEGLMLSTSMGYPVLGVDGEPIIIDDDIAWHNVAITDTGVLLYNDPFTNETVDLGMQIMLVQFPNVQGLEAVGGNLFASTVASGMRLEEAEGEVVRPSRLLQGVLEMSNVQVAEEMVNMIVAQRAFEVNSRVITTSDQMMQEANNLKR
jgi:flagellar basal-body rod protein FlgG